MRFDDEIRRALEGAAPRHYAIGNLRAGDALAPVDLEIDDGRIERIAPAGAIAGAINAGGRIALPCFVDIHTHLDMAHVVDVAPNRDGTHFGAVRARDAYRAAAFKRGEPWYEADIERRMEFALRCTHAHGTGALRTHLDSTPGQDALSWRVFERLRERWRGKLHLQGAALLPIDNYLTDHGRQLADRVAASGGTIGGITRLSGRAHGGGAEAQMRAAVEAVLRLASERNLDVDFHVDETGDPTSKNLDLVARAVLDTGFKGRVVCGHCCSLSVRPAEEAERALGLCKQAGLGVVSLPHVNLYLQDRQPGRTPRWRGIAPLGEMRAAGIPVALATDDVRDHFYPYGDHDLLAVLAVSAGIAHLDTPWLDAITSAPAAMMGLADAGRLRVGAPADLMIFAATRYSELLARPQADRVVVRNGRLADTRLPRYSELAD